MRGAGWEKSRKHVRGAEQGGGEQMKERVEARGLAVEWMVLRWHSARVPAAAVAEHRQCCAIMSTRVRRCCQLAPGHQYIVSTWLFTCARCSARSFLQHTWEEGSSMRMG